MARLLGYLTAGLLAVSIVGAVAIYGLDEAGRIEAGLQRAAGMKLAATGPVWASVEVRGRDAVLTGEALLPAERRQGAERAASALDAIPGIREVRDNTTARFKSPAEIETKLGALCARAVSDLRATWLKCAVRQRTVTLSGTTVTHSARREVVEKVFSAVERLGAREIVRDTTQAYYNTAEEMRKAFDDACNAAIADFMLNWLQCRSEDRRFVLSGAAPVEAERHTRVAAARAVLEAVEGVESVADETTVLPALASAEACRNAFDGLTEGKPVRFAAGTATVGPESEALLDALSVAAKRCIGAKIEVQGHTNASGDANRDRKLSEARAAAVADYMTGLGVPAGRIAARGYGSAHLRAANGTAESKALNRRVEFEISE
ncbi:MAG: OmpA family protein [Rhodospirillaceae bacterium]|nr:OmpA family protein [Rhodospirillaceae bacterium]MYB13875.1 OmpA family protein [Rhodospirillaceae bacterium]MYI48706.1 OmpA family protein [Rhodospirillaceae bacterium]